MFSWWWGYWWGWWTSGDSTSPTPLNIWVQGGSHCQAWWKPNTALSNFINIAAGGTCLTCLLPQLQMVGNIPDLLTPPGASAAGAPQPMQPIPLTPLCVHHVGMNVHFCISMCMNCHMATWAIPFYCPFFCSATHSLQQRLLWISLPFLRNSKPECVAWAPWCSSLSTIGNKTVQPFFPQTLYGDNPSPLYLSSRRGEITPPLGINMSACRLKRGWGDPVLLLWCWWWGPVLHCPRKGG